MEIGDIVTIPTGTFAGRVGEVAEISPKTIKVLVGIGRLPVDIPADTLIAIEQADAEAEANEKRVAKRKVQASAAKTGEGRGHDNKPLPSPSEEARKPEPVVQREDTPAADTRPPSVVDIVKKEGPKVETKTATQNTQAPARVEPLYCPTCPPDQQPKIRRRPNDLVCGDCYRQHINDAAITLGRGDGVVTLFDWVVGKAPAILPALGERLAAVKADMEKLRKEVGAEVYANLKKSAGGAQVAKEIWNQAFRTQSKELWGKKGGNALFARMRALEGRIALLESVLEESKKPKPTPPAPATEVKAPAVEAVPPATEKKTEKPKKTKAARK